MQKVSLPVLGSGALAVFSAFLAIAQVACSSDNTSSSGNTSGAGASGSSSGGAASGAGANSDASAGVGGSGAAAASGSAPSGSSGAGSMSGTTASGAVAGSGSAPSGASSGASSDAGPSDATMGSGTFTLTSPGFVGLLDPDASVPKDAAPTIPAVDTCSEPDAKPPLTGESPELDWSGAPAGTMSFVVTLLDLTNSNYHWSVWDLPASMTSLPMGLPKGPVGNAGAMQVSFQNGMLHNQYVGPCPNGALHEYQFTVWALNTPTLAGLTANPTSKEVYLAAAKVAIGRANYTGLSNAK